MIVNHQKDIKIINSCGAVYDERELIRAILWYSSKPVCRLKRVFVYGFYPAVSIYENKIHIHRLLMMYWLNGEIPDGFCVHHNDENKLHCTRRNLSLLNISFHQSEHNKGKTISDWQKKRITESNSKRCGKHYSTHKSTSKMFDCNIHETEVIP